MIDLAAIQCDYRRFIRALFAVAGLLFFVCGSSNFAQEPIVTSDLPASQSQSEPSLLPIDNQLPKLIFDENTNSPNLSDGREVSLDQLSELLADQTARRSTTDVELVSSNYFAIFTDGLLSGYSDLQLKGQSRSATFTLEPFSPALLKEPSDKEPLDVGEEPDLAARLAYFDQSGLPVYSVSKGDSKLAFRWEQTSISEREKSREIFELDLPWTAESLFTIAAPRDWILAESNVPFEIDQPANIPALADEAALSQHDFLKLKCGGQTRLRLEFERRKPAEELTKQLFAAEQTDWIVQTSGLEVTSRFSFAPNTVPSVIEVLVDSGLTIRNLTWDQQDIEWTYEKKRRIIRIIPLETQANIQTQHRLVITAISAWPLDPHSSDSRTQVLPDMRLNQAVAIEGRGSVSLYSDWELTNFELADATITSRSGTTGVGGLGRIDFQWKLNHPKVSVGVKAKKRQLKAESVTTIVNQGQSLFAQTRLQIDASNEIWNSIPIELENSWVLSSVRVIGSERTVQVREPKGEADQAHELIITPAVENGRLELEFNFHYQPNNQKDQAKDAGQYLAGPGSEPITFPTLKCDSVTEIVTDSGYDVEPSLQLIEAKVAVSELSVWQQRQLEKREQPLLVKTDGKQLPSIRYSRRTTSIDATTLNILLPSLNGLEQRFFLFCNSPSTLIEKIEVRISNSMPSGVYRVLALDGAIIRNWRDIDQSVKRLDIKKTPSRTNDEINRESTIASLNCDTEKSFIVECRFTYEKDEKVYLPKLLHQVSGKSYFASFDETPSLMSLRRTLRLNPISAAESSSLLNYMRVISPSNFVRETNSFSGFYAIDASVRSLTAAPVIESNKEDSIFSVVEKLFIDPVGRCRMSVEVELGERKSFEFGISLPKGWSLLNISDLDGITLTQTQERDTVTNWTFVTAASRRKFDHRVKMQFEGPDLQFEWGASEIDLPEIGSSPTAATCAQQLWLSTDLSLASEDDSSRNQSKWFEPALSQRPWQWPNLLFGSNANTETTETDPVFHGLVGDSNWLDTRDSRLVVSQTRDEQQFKSSTILLRKNTFQIVQWRVMVLQRWMVFSATCLIFAAIIVWMRRFALMAILGLILTQWYFDFHEFGEIAVFASALTTSALFLTSIMRNRIVRAKHKSDDTVSAVVNPNLSVHSLSKIVPTLVFWLASIGATTNCASAMQTGIDDANTAIQTGVLEIRVPVDVDRLEIGASATIKESSNADSKQTDLKGIEAQPRLLEAEHRLVSRRDPSAIFSRQAMITSHYRFEVFNDQQTIVFPWQIANAVFDRLTVNNELVPLGRNLRFDFASLVLKPERIGIIEIEIFSQLRLNRSLTSETKLRYEIKPCASATLEIQSDLKNANLLGHRYVAFGDNQKIPIAATSYIEMNWVTEERSSFQSSRRKYEIETELLLDQTDLGAVTKIRLDWRDGKEIAIDWNADWSPTGVYSNQIKLQNETLRVKDGRSQMNASLIPSSTAASSNIEIEIYWRPEKKNIFGLPLPNVRIDAAIASDRKLRFVSERTSHWTIDGVENWLPANGANRTGDVGLLAQPRQTKYLEVPETGGETALIRFRQVTVQKPSVRTSIKYTFEPQILTIELACQPVLSANLRQIERWRVDKSLRIRSIKINGVEAISSIESFDSDSNLVSTFVDPEIGSIDSILIEASMPIEDGKWCSLPTIDWLEKSILQSKVQMARSLAMNLKFNDYLLELINKSPLTEVQNLTVNNLSSETIASLEFGSLVSSAYEALSEPNADRSKLADLKFVAQSESQSPVAKIFCTASFQADRWKFRYEFLFSELDEKKGICVSIPKSSMPHIQFDGPQKSVGEFGTANLIYLLPNEKAGRLGTTGFELTVPTELARSEAFTVPEVRVVGSIGIACGLSLPRSLDGRELRWVLNGWQEMDAKESESFFSESLPLDSDRIFRRSADNIPSVQYQGLPPSQKTPTVPYAIVQVTLKDESYLVDALLFCDPRSSHSVELDVPAGWQASARLLDGSHSQKWVRGTNPNGGLFESIKIEGLNTDLPVLIQLLCEAKSNESLNDLRFSTSDIRVAFSDKHQVVIENGVYRIIGFTNEQINQLIGRDCEEDRSAQLVCEQIGVLFSSVPSLADGRSVSSSAEQLASWRELYEDAYAMISPREISQQKRDFYRTNFLNLFESLSVLKKSSYRNNLSTDFLSENITAGSVGLKQVELNFSQMHLGKSASLLDRMGFVPFFLWIMPIIVMAVGLSSERVRVELTALFGQFPWRLSSLAALLLAAVAQRYWESVMLATISFLWCGYFWIRNRLDARK